MLHNREGRNEVDLSLKVTLPQYQGTSTQGTWTLHVSDWLEGDLGALHSWSLTVVHPDIP